MPDRRFQAKSAAKPRKTWNKRPKDWVLVASPFSEGKIMAPRPYWTGAIRLSLVVLPVEIFSAVDPAGEVHFHQIHKPTGKRVRYQKIVEGKGPIENDDIAK